jgi:dephospho-CoA kinase
MTATTRIGLTGGIGSGKSTVAAMWAEAGAVVVDVDAISRQLTAGGGAAIDRIRDAFGAVFITQQGALDRDQMRALVFNDPAARQRLEAIVHPMIGLEVARQTRVAMDKAPRCIVYDVPLLTESNHWRAQLDWVLVVDCTPEVQIERTMHRSGLSRLAAEQIIAAQASRATRLRVADGVIFNADMSLAELVADVGQIKARFGL